VKKSIFKKLAGAILFAGALAFAVSCSSDSDDGGSEPTPSSSSTGDNTVTPGGTTATGVIGTPTVADVSNATVQIVKSEGWLNSAYVIFNQVEGATYKVLCDDVEIDQQLIRYYDTYTYYEASEDDNLQVSYTAKTLNNVVRADALGLAAGSHTIKVCAVGTENTSEYSTATMTVVDHDRSGFAFTGSTTPGAYKEDGTLKDGTIVIYLTQANKNTVTATIGGTTYTGIAAITQAVKTKNTGTTPVDIRVIGKVTAENNDLSCSDMSSAYALGVKEASYVTIEGVGHDATLYSAGVAAFKSDYIEISNLGLMKWGGGSDGDGISLKEDSYTWVHNCEFFYGDAGSDGDQVKGDGSMDMKDDSNHVTVSYNHFWDSGKMSLCGMKSESGPNYITYHHNWFDHSDSRHPRIRTMTVHVYNNYFDGNAKYGIGVTTGANCFAEGNFFRNAHDPMMSSMQGTDAQGAGTFSGENGGVIKAYNNKYEQNNSYGVKFQFITNKYDYTNDTAVTEPETHTETLGTENGDGTYKIYSWSYGETFPSFITTVNVTDKGASDSTKTYYQISKGKTGFTLTVPSNATSVVINAKSASSGVTAATLKVGGVSQTVADSYGDYTFDVSSLSDTSLDIVAGSEGSINVTAITVNAASTWTTTYTTGFSLSDIDAYEVDNREDQVPSTVTAKVGGTTYSNFDVSMGDSGMGVVIAPTDPDQAKTHVLKFSGRHESDFAYNFDNSTADASYAVDSALNSALVAYTTGLTAIQGVASTSSDSSSGGSDSGDSTSSGDSGSGDSGSTGSDTSSVSGSTVITFDSFTSGATVDGVTITGNLKSGIASKTYDGTTYTTALKMESSTSIAFTLDSAATLTLITDTASKRIKIDDTKYTTDTDGILSQSLEAGSHTVAKGDSLNVYAIIISAE